MGKRLSIILFTLIAFCATNIYLFRNVLLETLIGAELNKRNLPLQSIAALDVSIDGFHLRDLIAGENKEFRIHRARVVWNFHDIFAANAISVEISGLAANIAVSAKQISPPGESFLLQRFAMPWLSTLSLENSVIHFRTLAGDGAMTLSGGITPGREGQRALKLDMVLSGIIVQGRATLAARLDSQGNMQGSIQMGGALKTPELSIGGFSGNTAFKVAMLQLQNAQTEFVFSDILFSEKTANGFANKLAIDRAAFVGNVLGLPDFWTGKLDIDIENGQWVSESSQIRRLTAALPLQIDTGKTGSWYIGLRDAATVTVEEIGAVHSARTEEPLKLSFAQADFELTRHAATWSLRHNVVAMPGKHAVLLQRKKAAAIEAQAHPGKITFTGKIDDRHQYQGRIIIDDFALTSPPLHLETKDISVAAYWNDADLGNAADFSIGQLQFPAPQPLLTPLSISGSIRNQAAAAEPLEYVLNLSGGVPDGVRYIQVTASHAMHTGEGKLLAELGPINFSPDGLQPDLLLPMFGRWTDVIGRMNANAQLKWTAEGIASSRGSLDLRDFSFMHETIKVNDLNISLQIDDLSTLSSLPHQAIAIRRIDLGIPIEDLLVYYRLGQDPLHVMLEKAQFRLMDGLISVAPTHIDPDESINLTVHVSNFDLEALFDLIQIEGLAGSGRLDGQIPVTLAKNRMTVKGGHLAAKTPGVLHFKSEKAARYLASGGQEMNLLLQALQDFHYTELAIRFDKSANHDLSVKLSLLGNNPAVKNGQDFRLNIKFEAGLDKILKAIDFGHRLSDEILGGSFRFH